MSRSKLGGGGGGGAGLGTVNIVTLATRPAASAGNAGQVFLVVDDAGGRLQVSTGTAYVNCSPAVAEGAGPSASFTQGDVTGLKAVVSGYGIAEKLKAASQAARGKNPWDLPVMASPPTITVGAVALPNPVTFGYGTNTDRIRILGVPTADKTLMFTGSTYWEGRNVAAAGPTYSANVRGGYVARHRVTCQKAQLSVNGMSAALLRIRCSADGSDAIQYIGTSYITAGATTVEVDFGARGTYWLDIEFEQALKYAGIILSEDDVLWPIEAPYQILRIGDSYMQGITSPQVGGAVLNRALADMEGCNSVSQGITSSGYVSGVPLTLIDRLNFAVSAVQLGGIKYGEILLGTNDVDTAGPKAGVAAAVSTVLSHLLANTDAKWLVGGVWPQARNLSAALLATENEILTAASAFPSDRVLTLPMNTAATPPVFGARDTNTATGAAGPSRYVTGDDGVHLASPYGCYYMARWHIDARNAAVAAAKW